MRGCTRRGGLQMTTGAGRAQVHRQRHDDQPGGEKEEDLRPAETLSAPGCARGARHMLTAWAQLQGSTSAQLGAIMCRMRAGRRAHPVVHSAEHRHEALPDDEGEEHVNPARIGPALGAALHQTREGRLPHPCKHRTGGKHRKSREVDSMSHDKAVGRSATSSPQPAAG